MGGGYEKRKKREKLILVKVKSSMIIDFKEKWIGGKKYLEHIGNRYTTLSGARVVLQWCIGTPL